MFTKTFRANVLRGAEAELDKMGFTTRYAQGMLTVEFKNMAHLAMFECFARGFNCGLSRGGVQVVGIDLTDAFSISSGESE